MQKFMKIGQVANQSEVSVQTVRYYESLNLLNKPARSPAGYRLYNAEAVLRIRFIRRSQRLGFNLEEIKELLDLKMQNSNQCSRIKSKIGNKLGEIRRKLSELRKLEKILLEMHDACEMTNVTDPCPILNLLENNFEDRINIRNKLSECCGN
ncbi:MerR HTH family regulatory protein [Leptospira fainei serovar Hurstbridge str. BUT 6]|uniref:MerR HTH family regulatory protein n=1 Tax=Leptospira fainei serovar Hurstbridge str. BUT 6 TaxID=1193011 RepID=S3W1A0_9LEPT|nr:heavy metal-responsive transcriptional regulator [Leptospira fainei]EPG74057.1 MerR HTH family regulatory protein [Leptospira fainei serovar Hurstbridge str. BUT 6]